MKLCSGCGGMVEKTDRGRCAECGPTQSRLELRVVYDDARWRGPNGARRRAFVRDEWTCLDCGHYDPTETGAGLVGDHDPPVPTLLSLGLDVFDERYVVTRCLSCSGTKDGARGAAVRRA